MNHDFTVGTYANKKQEPLTLEQVAHFAPSAMAVAPHESRSDRYTYIPTVNIIQGLMQNGFQPFAASQSHTRLADRQDFTKHMIRFRHLGTNPTELMRVGDVVPEVVLINSHDGTSLYKLIAGLYRLVCSNGLMVSDSQLGSISIKHKGNILDNVIEGSYKLIESSDNVLSTVNNWTRLQLTSGEQTALAESAHTLRFADSEGNVDTPIKPAQLLTPRRYQDNGSDLWQTFNRIQENTIKGGLSARQPNAVNPDGRFVRGRKVSTRQVNSIDADVRLNRALWQLGERMAKLKQAV